MHIKQADTRIASEWASVPQPGLEGSALSLEKMIDLMPAAIYVCNRDGDLVCYNRRAVEIWGREPPCDGTDKYCGSLRIFSAGGEELPRTASPMAVVLRTGVAVRNQEAVIERPDGTRVAVLASITPLRDEAGNLTGAVNSFLDVTERDHTAAAQAKLAAIVESSDDAIISKTLNGYITSWNQAAQRLFGYTEEEVVGRHISILAPPERMDDIPKILDRIRRGERVEHFETQRVRKDGARLHVSLSVSPIKDNSGKIIGAAKIARDISERRRATAVHAQLAAIVESSEDAIIGKNLQGIIISWNRSAERLFGYAEHEVLGRHISLLAPPERVEDIARILDRIRRGERVEHFETQRVRKDGTRVHVSLSVSPIKDASGEIIGAAKIARDITERKRSEEALAQAKAAAEEANRAKDEFLAALSHELRTPLTPVLMTVQMLKDDPSLPDSVRADLAMIHRNVCLEARLIDDLLDLTRVSRGKMQIKPELVEIHDLLNHALETCCDESIREKGLQVRCDFAAERSSIWADPGRIEQVFWNLINNAVKFTPQGGRIHIRTASRPDGWVRVDFEDTGRGIEPAKLPLLFNAFEQGGAATTRQFGGLGLGLAICKAITGLHNGRISAHSDGPGRGARFTVELPVASVKEVAQHSVAANPPRQAETSPVSSARILLVEDHSPTALILKRLISRWGWEVEWASSASAARDRAAVEKFDLVISDLGLPDASGHELMIHLRAAHGLRGVALSGYGMDQDVQQSLNAGFSRHLTKPIDFEQLRVAIGEMLSGVDGGN